MGCLNAFWTSVQLRLAFPCLILAPVLTTVTFYVVLIVHRSSSAPSFFSGDAASEQQLLSWPLFPQVPAFSGEFKTCEMRHLLSYLSEHHFKVDKWSFISSYSVFIKGWGYFFTQLLCGSWMVQWHVDTGKIYYWEINKNLIIAEEQRCYSHG